MNVRDVVRRLEAFAMGRPLPKGSTLHFPRPSKRDLLLAFVRMGGESSPWGIAWRKGSGAPSLLSVPEPRNRDAVAAMAAEFAPNLLDHLGLGEEPEPYGRDNPPAPIWLPNPTHVSMLHFLAIAYTFAKKGARERVRSLNGLGRAFTWLFMEAQRPGQLAVLDATEVLRESYTFPSDDVRQAHLGFLLAWLRTKGGVDARLTAAVVAERQSVATSLDPEIERSELESHVEGYRELTKGGASGAEDAGAIAAVIRRELLRRLDLVAAARASLEGDERDVNPGVTELRALTGRQYELYSNREGRLGQDPTQTFVPSPLTDGSPTVAARSYRVLEASSQRHHALLVHHDAEMQDDAIAAGDAFRGRIKMVLDEGEGRKAIPIWVIDSPGQGPLRLREGSSVCVVGLPKRTAFIRSIKPTKKGRRIEVEIEGLKTVPKVAVRGVRVIPASDDRHKGQPVAMLNHGPDPMLMLQLSKAFEKGGPGSWLTHSKAGAVDQVKSEEGRP